MIDLSVLICSTHTRYDTFGRSIQDQIWSMYDKLPESLQDRVEILMLTDNKKMMLGHKRNIMVDAAQGRYVAFVDDDDRIEPDYLRSLLDAIACCGDVDVITFLVSVSLNGEPPKICRYSKDFPGDYNLSTEYHRLPNHICCVKREIALQVSFPNIAYGEDSGYSKLLRTKLETEHAIDRVRFAARLHCLERRHVFRHGHHLRTSHLLHHGVRFLVVAVRVAAEQNLRVAELEAELLDRLLDDWHVALVGAVDQDVSGRRDDEEHRQALGAHVIDVADDLVRRERRRHVVRAADVALEERLLRPGLAVHRDRRTRRLRTTPTTGLTGIGRSGRHEPDE